MSVEQQAAWCAELAWREGERVQESGACVRLSTGDLQASLRATPELADWTSSYCGGFLEVSQQPADRAEVLVVHEPSLLSALADLGREGWRSEAYWEERDIGGGEATLVRTTTAGGYAYYFLWPRADRMVVIVDRGDPEAPMVAMRSVRSLLLRRIELAGWTFLHAAGVARGSRCVLITGNKFSGKTTTLLRLLLRGYDLLSNDKVALQLEGGGLVAQGFPVAAGIRIGTLAALEDPSQVLAAARDPLTVQELLQAARRGGEAIHRLDEKVRLDPRKLAEACGVGVASRCPPGGILVSRYAPDAEAGVELLDKRRAAETLREMRLDGLEAISPEHGFLRYLGGQAAARAAELEGAVAQRVPVYAVTQNASSGQQLLELVVRLIGA
jgi:hypothetical protein